MPGRSARAIRKRVLALGNYLLPNCPPKDYVQTRTLRTAFARYFPAPVFATRISAPASTLADAAAREAQAQNERVELRRRNEDFDREREGLLRKATDEAALERQRLIEAARQDSLLLRSKLTEALTYERTALNRQFLTQTQAEVLALARGTLNDLAGVELEARMTEIFIAHLRDLPQEQRRLLDGGPRRAWQSPSSPVALVRSAFEIASSRRPDIESAIRECLGTDVTIRFETLPELVCGIELRRAARPVIA